MAKETAPVKNEQPATNITAEQIDAILRQNQELMTTVANLSKLVEQPKPKETVHEVMEPIETPRKIRFRISAYEPDDAMIDGQIIPGKKIVGAFKYTSEVAMDGNDAYRTGFELDQLEQESGMTGQELANYQKDVKIAKRFVERVTGQSTSNLNKNFWQTKGIVVDNLGIEYETSLVENLIKYYNILGGAFPGIAKNREDAIANQKLLYLDIDSQEATSKVSLTMNRMEASAALKTIRDSWKTKDILLLIYALSNHKNHGYTFDTPKDILIKELDEFIQGADTKTEKKKRPVVFLDAVDSMTSVVDGDRIRCEGLLKAGEYYNFVQLNKEKTFILRESGNALGSSVKSAVEYLLNPINSEDFGSLMASVIRKWTN